MLTLTQIAVAAIAGATFAFTQSLIAGKIAKTWSGGTGIVWGLIISVPSCISAIWIGWYAMIGVASVMKSSSNAPTA